MTRTTLIKDLEVINQNKYVIYDQKQIELDVESMLEYIGDPDSYLRDDLIYMTFVMWIEVKKYLDEDYLKVLLFKLLSNEFAFYHLGEKDNNTILKRSFSILVVSSILERNSDKGFLNNEELSKVQEALLTFFQFEKDLRGYDNELGWIHALAHVSDCLVSLTKVNKKSELALKIMEIIKYRLQEGVIAYAHQEDERMIQILYGVIIRNKYLKDIEICDWLNSLKIYEQKESYQKEFIIRNNIKKFLRSLYFRFIHDQNIDNIIASEIITIEKTFTRF